MADTDLTTVADKVLCVELASQTRTTSPSLIIPNADVPFNSPPVASAVAGTTAEDTDFSGSLSGSDADGDDLTYAIASNPSNGSVTLNSATQGTFTYSPTANYNGSDTFTYTVNDGTVTSSAGTAVSYTHLTLPTKRIV